ncbi:hypothetical protein JCM3766R1_000749 [Sporobolomyces carnicolor]
MSPSSNAPALTLIRTDEISRDGQVRTTFREVASDLPLYFAASQYVAAVEGHKTTLYSRHAQVGSVSLDSFQVGSSREIDASTFYTRPSFFSEKLVWKSFEGKQLRWKRDDSGALLLIDHKSRQTLATAHTNLTPSGEPRTILKVHPSLLLTATSRAAHPTQRPGAKPISRTVAPVNPSPSSSADSSPSPSTKLTKRASGSAAAIHSVPTLDYNMSQSSNFAHPPPPPSPEQPSRHVDTSKSRSGGTTLELVILSLLHQDYQRLDKERQLQIESDARSNHEWDSW